MLRAGRCGAGRRRARRRPGLDRAGAAQARFTLDGTVTSPVTSFGCAPGSAVSFTWVLDAGAINQSRRSGPNCTGCNGTLGWHQDLFSATPQRWASITGTRLTGAWQPPTDVDTGAIAVSVGSFPQPCSGTFELRAQSTGGGPTAWRSPARG